MKEKERECACQALVDERLNAVTIVSLGMQKNAKTAAWNRADLMIAVLFGLRSTVYPLSAELIEFEL